MHRRRGVAAGATRTRRRPCMIEPSSDIDLRRNVKTAIAVHDADFERVEEPLTRIWLSMGRRR